MMKQQVLVQSKGQQNVLRAFTVIFGELVQQNEDTGRRRCQIYEQSVTSVTDIQHLLMFFFFTFNLKWTIYLK